MDTATDNTFTLYHSPNAAWNAMLLRIAEARQSIDIEHFIFKQPGIGSEFLTILAQKAAEGVRVRLLLDAIGSVAFMSGSLAARCKAAGIELRFFNTMVPLTLNHHTPLFFRDHQKLIVIDGEVGITGGVCIEERMRHWRDTAVILRGTAVAHMQTSFQFMWELAHKEKRWRDRPPVPEGNERYLLDMPFSRHRPAYRQLRKAIKLARSHIILATPYFVPPHRLVRNIKAAARRGVQVTLLLTRRSDTRLADAAAQSYFHNLLEAGVRIFRYDRTTYHAKLAVIDSAWAMCGSHNLDHLSFQFNFEGSLVTNRKELVNAIEAQLMLDIAEAKEVLAQVWSKRSILSRIKEVLIWPMSFFM